MAKYVGKRIIPRHGGAWDKTKSYEPLTIVLAPNGDSYTSCRDVPAGVELSNPDYWALGARFSAQLKETYDQMTRDMNETLHQMNEDFSETHQGIREDIAREKEYLDTTHARMNEDMDRTLQQMNADFARKHQEIDADLAAEKKHVDDTVADMRQELTQTEAQLTAQTQGAVNLTTRNRTEIESRMAVIEKRQDANVSASTDRNANYAAELVDARVSAMGSRYKSLGEAVRSQVQEVYSTLGAAWEKCEGIDRSDCAGGTFNGFHYYAVNNDAYDMDVYLTTMHLIPGCAVNNETIHLFAIDENSIITKDYGEVTVSGAADTELQLAFELPLKLDAGERVMLYRKKSFSIAGNGFLLRFKGPSNPLSPLTGFQTHEKATLYSVGDAISLGNFGGNIALWFDAGRRVLPFETRDEALPFQEELRDARVGYDTQEYASLGESIRGQMQRMTASVGLALTPIQTPDRSDMTKNTFNGGHYCVANKDPFEQDVYVTKLFLTSKTDAPDQQISVLAYDPDKGVTEVYGTYACGCTVDEITTVEFEEPLFFGAGEMVMLHHAPGFGTGDGIRLGFSTTRPIPIDPVTGFYSGGPSVCPSVGMTLKLGEYAQNASFWVEAKAYQMPFAQKESLVACMQEIEDARHETSGRVYASLGEAVRAIGDNQTVLSACTHDEAGYTAGKSKSTSSNLYGNNTLLPQGYVTRVQMYVFPRQVGEQHVHLVTMNPETQTFTDWADMTFEAAETEQVMEVVFDVELKCNEGDVLVCGASTVEMSICYQNGVEGYLTYGVFCSGERLACMTEGDPMSVSQRLPTLRMSIMAYVNKYAPLKDSLEELLVRMSSLEKENAALEEESIGLGEEMTGLKSHLQQMLTAVQASNFLYGKILSVTGDSEAAGHSVGRANTYGGLIAARNGMTLNMYAINGRKLCTGSATSVCDTYSEIAADSDYILVQIGYNDSFNAAVDDESKDTTTYKGAFNVMLEGMMQTYPKARIGILVPYYFDGNATKKARAQWMMERCKHYHVQCFDGCANSGLDYKNAAQKDYFLDAVHLSKAGHERISWVYENFLKGC